MDQSRFEKGLEVRRKVLGDAYVDKSLNAATEFTQPLQELVTENCWGAVWQRDGLDKATRSLVTLSMLIALKANNEIKVHTLGALRNGATKEQIQEVLLHASAYCGFPATIDAFKAAKEVVDDWDAGKLVKD